MGEVYRAKDTRLGRTVAVKLLPARLSEDPRLQQRFEREARALAGLSHPRICTLHDVGHEDGVRFLVMELLEGETLAERLGRGALPLEQVLDTGIEIADALDAAHRRGVIHRDVKPGNVMLTKSGVKLLDFGLARDASPPAMQAPTATSETATRQANLTAEGSVVGTPSYMAPEQLEGSEADARSDVFSLGSTLYEMTTGARPFRGNSQAGLVADILTGSPAPMTEVRPTTPAALSRAVDRCLAKDPEARWQSARDLMLELKWIADGGSIDGSGTARPRSRWPERIAWVVSLLLLATAVAWFALRPGRAPAGGPATRLSVALPDGASNPFTTLSPDGSTLAISLRSAGRQSIWLRPLDSLSSRPLPGTEGGHYPFWSPDGRYVGFFADGKLKKVDIRGGPPQVLCDAPGPFSMGTWGRDGTIVFNVLEAPGHEGVFRVSDAGGTATKLTLLDDTGWEILGAWPSFLPDDRHFLLFCGYPERREAGLCVASLDTSRATLVLDIRSDRGSRAEYAAPGLIVYTRDGALVAQAFDPVKRAIAGEPVTLAEQIESSGPIGLDNFSVAGDVLVYLADNVRSEIVWKDRNGRTLGRVGSPGAYADVTLGPDDEKLALSKSDLQEAVADIWIVELDRDVATRFTTPVFDDVGAVWSPDGRRVAFSSAREAPPFLHVKDLAGGDATILLPSRGTLQVPNDWSPDGKSILYSDRDPTTDWDLWILPLEDERDPVPFLKTPFKERTASFSPDGSRVAYASDESGRAEIYVTTFPDGGEKRRISTGGGYLPYWRSDGNELYYLSLDNRVMAVPVRWDPAFEPGGPVALFSFEPAENAYLPYDVTSDGERFIVITPAPGETTTPTVATGWSAQLSN
jgi:serine/threonine protein kinase